MIPTPLNVMMLIKCLIWNMGDSHTKRNGSEGGAAGDSFKAEDGCTWQGSIRKLPNERTFLISFISLNFFKFCSNRTMVF